MKKLIFRLSNFFGSGHFLITDILKNDQKMTGAKKVKLLKNQVLHAQQPHKEIFEFCSCSGLIFMTNFWNFEFLFQDGETFFQKNFLAQIIIYDYYFGWFDAH